MKHLKSRDDVRRALAAGAPAKHMVAALGLIRNLEEGYRPFGGWVPEEHGWAVLLDRPGDLQDLAGLHLAGPLAEAPWEAVEDHPELGVFVGICIMGNDFGLGYVIPKSILDPATAAALAEEARHSPRPCPPAPAS